MTDIREPDDWQVGDRAYVHDHDEDWNVGDTFTVRYAQAAFLGKSLRLSADSMIAKRHCRRILTPDEVRALQPGDVVVKTRGPARGDAVTITKPTEFGWSNSSYGSEYIALVSLTPRTPIPHQQALNELAEAREALARAEKRVAERST